DLSAIPYMEGAEETVHAGIVSSLQPQNVRLRRAIANLDDASQDPRYPLIFDPQTAGGLLASLPAERAEGCIQALKGLGYDRSAIIGRVKVEGDALQPITIIR
ncbi:MAG: selenide, water dikinase SelD, partial [Alphaproteobacteria bacterium]